MAYYRVLVVDDEPAIAFALSEYLGLRGFSVRTAATFEEACELVRRTAYDVVVTDLSLGGRGGSQGLYIATLARLHHRATRAVILTAYGSPEVEASTRLLGVDAFLHKPMPLAEIAQTLERILQPPATK